MKVFLHLSFYIIFYCSLLAQPENDNCIDAVAVVAGETVSFSTIGATTDGPFHPNDTSPCSSSTNNDTLFSDIWYVFTAEFTGLAEWSLCGTADFDTKIAVYQPGISCPPKETDVQACNDDEAGCPYATSRVLFGVTEGEIYLLRLGGWGSASPGETGAGTFIIEEYMGELPNDYCLQATNISLGMDQTFSNIGATTDGPEHPFNEACFGFDDRDVQADIWYSFTAPSTSTVEWSTCEMIESFDTRLAVYNAGVECMPTDDDLMACNDDGAGCSDYTSRVVFDVVEGETYLMRLGGWNGETGSGTFDFFETTPPVPPSNDHCADAGFAWISTPNQLENMGNPILGTTIDATFDQSAFQLPNAQCFNGDASGDFATVWYWFNTLGNPKLDFHLFKNSDQVESAFYMDLFDSCGVPIDTNAIFGSCLFVDVNDDSGKTTVSGLPDEPTVFLLRITTYLTFDLPGDFSLFIVGNGTTGAIESYPGQFKLFPNPVNEKLHLKLALEENEDTGFRIINAVGQTVLATSMRQLEVGPHQFEFNVAMLPEGLYYLVLESEKGISSVRFVKQ